MHTYRKSSLLACFFDLLFDLFLCFFNHFLDTGRMDTTVVDQFFQSNAGNLTAYGVKTGNNYRLRRIVNDQVNTGQSFQCPDISALTANDTAFHFIIRQGYYWPTLEEDCVIYVRRCVKCQLHADKIHAPSSSLHPLSSPWPFSMWAFDIIGPLGDPNAQIKQKSFILTATEYFTKWTEAAAFAEIKGSTVCRFIMKNIISRFGVPSGIVTDNGPQFISQELQDLCKRFNISLHHSSPYYPQGNGQTEFVYGLTGLEKFNSGKVTLDGKDITNASIRERSKDGMSHIPEDRHKHGLVLDYSLENNIVLQRYWQPEFQQNGFIRSEKVREYSDRLIEQYDVRSGQGSATIVRSMSGGNQQKAIIAREIDKDPKLLVAVQPTRGLDVGAIEYIHRQIVAQRDKGKAVLLVSLELDEVMNLSDRILVMYEGEVVGEFDPKTTTVQELGLYMAGARKQGKESK